MASKKKTVSLARLLHKDCTQLLELYTTREHLAWNSAAGSQLVSVTPLTPQITPSEKICFLHAALRACLHLLDKAITRQDAAFPQTPDDEYTTQRRTVRDRLSHLVYSTERLLVGGKKCDAEVKDSVDGSGTFAVKSWVLQVLQDVVHWSNKTAEVLQNLPALTASGRKRRSARKQETRKRHK